MLFILTPYTYTQLPRVGSFRQKRQMLTSIWVP